MTTESNGQDQDRETRSVVGVAIPIGAGGGVALGLVLDNLALGIAIGIAIGVAIGAGIDQRRRQAGEGE